MSDKKWREKLEEIKKRADEATPGEWKTFDRGFDDSFPTTVDFSRIMAVDGSVVRSCVMVRLGRPDKICMEKADAEFVTHARTDVPRLLAVIEKLIEWDDRKIEASYDGVYKNINWNLEAIQDAKAERNAELLQILEGGK